MKLTHFEVIALHLRTHPNDVIDLGGIEYSFCPVNNKYSMHDVITLDCEWLCTAWASYLYKVEHTDFSKEDLPY